ncbi:hypothetical protein ENBRE01_3039 [Enteropsectra breve]|nr:hypothetical protein ENBRE01_3039 [Enteropsectra breve]
MIWRAFSFFGKSKLHFFEENINSTNYKRVLHTNLIHFLTSQILMVPFLSKTMHDHALQLLLWTGLRSKGSKYLIGQHFLTILIQFKTSRAFSCNVFMQMVAVMIPVKNYSNQSKMSGKTSKKSILETLASSMKTGYFLPC